MRVCRQRILGQFCEAVWCIAESSVAVLNTERRMRGGSGARRAGEARTAEVLCKLWQLVYLLRRFQGPNCLTYTHCADFDTTMPVPGEILTSRLQPCSCRLREHAASLSAVAK
eukprot:4842664-Prymnesium_polylepis.1